MLIGIKVAWPSKTVEPRSFAPPTLPHAGDEFAGNGFRDELPDSVVEVYLSLPFAGGFDQGRSHRLEERDVVAQADRFIVSGT